MAKHRNYTMDFAKVYAGLVAKAERKGCRLLPRRRDTGREDSLLGGEGATVADVHDGDMVLPGIAD